MENQEKHWESGPNQHNVDERVKEQVQRAAKESERRKENLDDKGEGSYREKNGDQNTEYRGLENEPKLDKKPTHPLTDD